MESKRHDRRTNQGAVELSKSACKKGILSLQANNFAIRKKRIAKKLPELFSLLCVHQYSLQTATVTTTRRANISIALQVMNSKNFCNPQFADQQINALRHCTSGQKKAHCSNYSASFSFRSFAINVSTFTLWENVSLSNVSAM